MSRSPREVAEQVRRMVAGEGVDFADLFAPDGVLTYPFGLPGQPDELRDREAIRAYFAGRRGARDLLVMEGVELKLWDFANASAGHDMLWRYKQERDGNFTAEQVQKAMERANRAAPMKSKPRDVPVAGNKDQVSGGKASR